MSHLNIIKAQATLQGCVVFAKQLKYVFKTCAKLEAENFIENPIRFIRFMQFILPHISVSVSTNAS